MIGQREVDDRVKWSLTGPPWPEDVVDNVDRTSALPPVKKALEAKENKTILW